MAYSVAAAEALRDGLRKASPVLLEPIMRVEVVTPEEFLGEVLGDLNGRRAQIEDVAFRGTKRVAVALVPLRRMFGYSTDLRSVTQGRATFSMTFARYDTAQGSA